MTHTCKPDVSKARQNICFINAIDDMGKRMLEMHLMFCVMYPLKG